MSKSERALAPEPPAATRIESAGSAPSFDLRHLRGPFDIVGDVHGCGDELIELLGRLGYHVTLAGSGPERAATVGSAHGRTALFVGDFVDRGPRSPDVLRIVMAMCEAGLAHAVLGNHDAKFARWLAGRNVQPTHGLDRTIAQFEAEPADLKERAARFLDGLPLYLWLDGGSLAVAHGGILPEMLGQSSNKVRHFCLYGDTTGEQDASGLPVRYHWGARYSGTTAVVYGHTPIPSPEWVSNTLCIDTGCCFGGSLSALRWPERDSVSVPARAVYFKTLKPFGHPPLRPDLPAASCG